MAKFYENSPELREDRPSADPDLQAALHAQSGANRTPFFSNSDHVPEPNLPAAGDGAVTSPSPAPDAGRGQFNEDLPDKIKELREAPERQLFDSHKQYSNVFKRGTNQDALVGEDPALVEQVDRFAAGVYSDMRLSNAEAQQVHEMFTTEITDEVAANWRTESEEYLRSLGIEGPAKLELAKDLVRRDPRVHGLLKGPYGDNPKLLKLLIEKAHAERRDGRL